ncbi:hypothetical protein [Nostoc sp. JL33]|uniref:hypothetical protein n=1 Tax=Nostoc sp. JL33 TaxID=2815396 RepID=UPI0026002BB6|nr:hypothetical protein [Nostoc sp. JL33]MBN3869596.1 hypothetical protein [Nostoc sp. JL33]
MFCSLGHGDKLYLNLSRMWKQYGSVKARDAINRRLYKELIIVKTAIASLRLAACHQKTLSEPYWMWKGNEGRHKQT